MGCMLSILGGPLCKGRADRCMWIGRCINVCRNSSTMQINDPACTLSIHNSLASMRTHPSSARPLLLVCATNVVKPPSVTHKDLSARIHVLSDCSSYDHQPFPHVKRANDQTCVCTRGCHCLGQRSTHPLGYACHTPSEHQHRAQYHRLCGTQSALARQRITTKPDRHRVEACHRSPTAVLINTVRTHNLFNAKPHISAALCTHSHPVLAVREW